MIRTVKKNYLYIAVALCVFIVFGCACVKQRVLKADNIAEQSGMEKQIISADGFHLISFVRLFPESNKNFHIYLEGDGASVTGTGRASMDPTPINPVGLKLAALDKDANVVYLARPCQFEAKQIDMRCSPKYWTTHKYSAEIVSSINEAINKLIEKYSPERTTLIGFSGGGTIAALVAARRHDIYKLITIAGNLDHVYHTQQFKITPLYGSLNPTDYADRLSTIAQIHFIGREDSIIPKSVLLSYKEKIHGDEKTVKIVPIKGADHTCCWEKVWRDLLEAYVNN